jgi:hypothetical protein
MANLKLSQLPAATGLTGDELIPIVQGGQTRRSTAASVADLRKGSWQAPSLNAPWSNYGDPFTAAAYRRDANRIQLRGLVKGGTGSSVVLTLPAGFRPGGQLLFAAVSDSTAPTRIDVKPNGDVLLSTPQSGVMGWLSLDGVTFVAE